MNPVNQRIDFFQDQFRKPTIKLPLHQMLMIWLGVFVFWGLLSLLDFYSASKAETKFLAAQGITEPLERTAAQLQAEIDVLGKDAKGLTRTEQQLRSELTEKSQFLASVRQQGANHEITFAKYLRALTVVRSDAVWLTQVSISSPGPQLTLTGMATTPTAIPNYLDRFKEQPQFDGLGFDGLGVTRTNSDNQYVGFSVSTESDERD